MESIHYPSGAWNYFYYDARQRRYAIQDSDGLSYLTWDTGGLRLPAERDTMGEATTNYTHGQTPIPGIGSTVAVQQPLAGGTYYQYPIMDHRGTVVALTDEDGAPVATYEYNAWGQSLHAAAPTGAPNRLRYQSNWLALKDSEGEMYLSPTRVYDAVVGRFVQRDRDTSAMSHAESEGTSGGAQPHPPRSGAMRLYSALDRRALDVEPPAAGPEGSLGEEPVVSLGAAGEEFSPLREMSYFFAYDQPLLAVDPDGRLCTCMAPIPPFAPPPASSCNKSLAGNVLRRIRIFWGLWGPCVYSPPPGWLSCILPAGRGAAVCAMVTCRMYYVYVCTLTTTLRPPRYWWKWALLSTPCPPA